MTSQVLLVLFGLNLTAAEPYLKTDYMIPMRDGINLHTEVWRPATAIPNERLPFLIQRSPYGWARAKSVIETSFDDLARERYLFVFQDIRGRYQSEGEFVMQRPLHDRKVAKSIDEGTDTYDTIEWLLKKRRRPQRPRRPVRNFLWRLAHRDGVD